MQARGVVAIVCLNREWELFVPSSAYKTIEPPLRRLHLPVSDFQAPSLWQVEEAMRFIVEQKQCGTVYIHCNAGKGRSGVIAVAYELMSSFNGWKGSPFAPEMSIASAFKAVQTKRSVLSKSLLRYPFFGQARVLEAFKKTLSRRRLE
jgi:hypothetical protein